MQSWDGIDTSRFSQAKFSHPTLSMSPSRNIIPTTSTAIVRPPQSPTRTRSYLARGRPASEVTITELPTRRTESSSNLPSLNERQVLATQLEHLSNERRGLERRDGAAAPAERQGLAIQLAHLHHPEIVASLSATTELALTSAGDLLRQRRYAPLTQQFLPGSSEESRAASEQRIAARRTRIDTALDALQSRIRADAVDREALDARVLARREQRRAEIAEVAGGLANRRAMVEVLRDLADAHRLLLSRFAELQHAMELAPLKPLGMAPDEIEMHLPALPYSLAVLRGSRGCELPGGVECAICQSAMSRADAVRLLPCRHAFHAACIDPWLGRSTCCPLCRAEVVNASDRSRPDG